MPARGELTDDRALRARGVLVAEGRFVVARLLADPAWDVTDIFLTPAAERATAADLARVDPARRPVVHRMSPAELDEAGGFRFHQGCLAHARRRPVLSVGEWIAQVAHGAGPLAPSAAAPVVLLESVRDPDNVGAIFRNGAALGARAIVLGPGCADPWYRKTIRTSMAAVFALPWAVATDWPGDLARIRSAGWTVLALTPAPESAPLPELASGLAGRAVALLVGSEGDGLTAAAMAGSDRRVRVPMSAGMDSLNVATAVAVSLYALAHAHD